MKCLESFNITFDCSGRSGRVIEFRQFVDKIMNADWMGKHLEMGGVISGFRRFGYACISAGLQMRADSSGKLNQKYFTDRKYLRSLEVIPKEDNN